ncbi:protein LTO1 homolog isoform X1 [Chrysoperla carnea]|uniref:protein LTO1 homolog isoform X1 n=2 Tax=Chrysoperla carnea TaxID=189513 RepID=UPI001D06B9CD|nr:protein LTO1 homolog isoform X1 [Chrysoperla carnea]
MFTSQFTQINNEDMDEVDINDVFDDLVLSEDRGNQTAYNIGYNTGKTDGNIEAYHFGYHRGTEIGTELGYYFGIIKIYQTSTAFHETTDETLIRDVHTIISYIESIPSNVNFEQLIETIEKIRALFKKICSRLKIQCQFNSTKNSLTF